jgi:hypothetical protein
MKKRIFALLFCTAAFLSPAIRANDGLITVSTQTVIDIPLSKQVFSGVNPNERYVQLGDESRWKIPEEDLYVLRRWAPGQFVVITPDSGWFSDYNYHLTNQSRGEYVRANLLRGPTHTSGFSHHISGMDQNNKKKSIMLDKKTCWSISEEHFHVIKGWEVGDAIIVGVNNAWFTNYDTILINVETNTFAKARRI